MSIRTKRKGHAKKARRRRTKDHCAGHPSWGHREVKLKAEGSRRKPRQPFAQRLIAGLTKFAADIEAGEPIRFYTAEELPGGAS